MILYALLKFDRLISRSNPNVSTYLEQSVLTSEDSVKLKDVGIRFAFAIEGYVDGELKNDPRFVKTIVRLSGREDGKSIEKRLDYHLCTEEDFKDFAEPTLDAKKKVDKILKDPKRGLYCFDWDKIAEDLTIAGISTYDSFRFIELNLTPCQYLHTWWGNPDTIHEDCIRDKEQ